MRKHPRWLAELLQRLALEAPLDKPVQVELTPRLSAKFGECSETGDGAYRIRLRSSLSRPILMDTLLHEWAHAMTWGYRERHHGAAWGVAYARLYSVFIDGD